MASPDLSARLRYLNDSAHLLATTAPTTSKYLVSKCNSLMFDNSIEQPESHKRKVCGACGTIMILGWHGRVELQSQRSRRGKNVSAEKATDRARAMVYKCESCGRKSRINISSSAPKRKSSSVSHTEHLSSITPTSNTPLLPGISTPPQPTSNTSATTTSASKKRSKAKKQSGLEAILARQRATDSRGSGFGLNLFDFMKKN